MDSRLFCNLAVMLIIGHMISAVKSTNDDCKFSPKERLNCGFGGITKQECIDHGCCFDDVTPDAIWCFIPEAATSVCDIPLEGRIKCDSEGNTQSECFHKGCCFDDEMPEGEKCFMLDPASSVCDIPVEERTKCDSEGNTQKECQDNGCCFDDEMPEGDKCFMPEPAVKIYTTAAGTGKIFKLAIIAKTTLDKS
ncbi:putative gastrointestinal growth factor xP4 [Pelobates fuscus]|uniref:putative gastrointestinal growth factor xP4 n=1 Tax=Pelobates fuscus TaxID=191477 RepID=UPI002FE43644